MDNMGYDGHHNAPVTPGLPSPRGGATPWRDQDYDYPASVGPVRQVILLNKLFLSTPLIIHFRWKSSRLHTKLMNNMKNE